MKSKNLNQKGDTIIEVMLAMSLLSLFLFISWGVTNRSSQISANARTRIVMVNALKEQAEIIKAKTTQGTTSSITSGINQSLTIPDDPCESAVMDQSTGVIANSFHYAYDQSSQTVIKRTNFKKVNNNNEYRVWVQQKQSGPSSASYTDFYVRGCWVTLGGVQQLDNSNFILRLNN